MKLYGQQRHGERKGSRKDILHAEDRGTFYLAVHEEFLNFLVQTVKVPRLD